MLRETTIIDTRYEEIKRTLYYLSKAASGDLYQFNIDNFRKVLLISVASYFEEQVTMILQTFIENATQIRALQKFTITQSVNRKYHTWFNWEAKNANQFWGYFGEEFKAKITEEIRNEQQGTEVKIIVFETSDNDNEEPKSIEVPIAVTKEEAIKAFLDIGNKRNQLVHNSFAAYSLNDTSLEDVYVNYKKGLIFINYLEEKLQNQVPQIM